MPTTASPFLLLLFSVFLSASGSSDNRRILHEPLVPLDSLPPLQSPVSSPPDFPFSSSTPNNTPFFPDYPPPPSPPSPASFASFPANISSLIVPETSKPKRTSSKLVATAVSCVVAAVIVVSIAVALHLRRVRNRSTSSESKTERSDFSSRLDFGNNGGGGGGGGNPVIPKLRRPSQPSSEFLYLGTMVSSVGGIETHNQQNSPSSTTTSAATSRKLESPELQPLPPLHGRNLNFRQHYGNVEGRDDEDEEFYSPRGSSIGTGSASRRAFAAIEVENFGGSNYSSSSSSSSSGSSSPRRSVSLSISPPVSSSPKNSRPKSPELVAVQTTFAHPQHPPPPPPPQPPVFAAEPVNATESQSPSPANPSSPERYSRRSIDSSSRITSPSLNSPVRISSPNVESPVRIHSPGVESPARISSPVAESPARISSSVIDSPARMSSSEMESQVRISSPAIDFLPTINSPIMESPARICSPAMESPPKINSPGFKSPVRISSPSFESPVTSPVRISSSAIDSLPRINSPKMESPTRTSSPAMESPPRINSPKMESPSTTSSSTMESPPRINSLGIESPERICSPSLVITIGDQGMESPVRISSTVIDSPARIHSVTVESPARMSNTVIDSLPMINNPVIESLPRINSPIVESPPRINSPGMESPVRISSPVLQSPAMDSPVSISSPVQHNIATLAPPPPLVPHILIPPPPPPPPPPSKHWESPRTPNTQPQKLVSEPPVLVNPLRPIAIESPTLISPIQLPSHLEPAERNSDIAESCSSENVEKNEETPKPKLKPLHWDKVRASSDREMVWDQLKSSSFKLNEEMIETLFVVNTPNKNPNETAQRSTLPSVSQENRVLDPKKSQNIAISLRALNVTSEEVCDALLEGNADYLGTELLESLMKMAPTKEEERKLKEYTDDSPFKLGPAEKFLKALLDIPFAFKRVDAMLYISNFESEIDYLKKSFETLEAACEELRSSRMFLKLLEAVLKTGNRMNVGTNRGDAHAFKLDTLLKLVDIKGADGRTTLLHFVVQEIIRSEGARLSTANQYENSSIIPDDAKCRKLGLQVVSSLSSELTNVKKSAAMDSEILHSDVLKLSKGIMNIAEVVRLNETMVLDRNNSQKFSESMNRFTKMAEEEIIKLQASESVAMSLVKEITEYFHGNSTKEEAHPFRIFMVVRDFLMILERVCKEVGMINEKTIISSAHKFPVPVNPMQFPVPVNPMLQPMTGRQQCSFSGDESS